MIHAIIIAPPCRSATDSAATRPSCASSRTRCSSAREARRRERLRLRRVRGLRPDASRCARASPTPSSTTATARSASRVYFGERPKARRGHASTSDFSRAALEQTVDAAVGDRAPHRRGRLRRPAGRRAARARHARPRSLPSVGAVAPRRRSSSRSAARRRRSRCRRRSATPRAPRVSAQQTQFVFANSLGFIGGYRGSRHYLSCAVIAEDKGLMQRDDWYSASRVPGEARRPARARPLRRPARRGAPRRAQDRHLPGAGAVRGAGRDRPDRPLRLGGERRQPVPQDLVPASTAWASRCSRRCVQHRGAPARAAGHGEQRRSTRRAWRRASAPIVRDGVVEGYFLGSYSARKLGMKSTGNAGGHHNLVVESGGPDFARHAAARWAAACWSPSCSARASTW